jgi:hypothetical protein
MDVLRRFELPLQKKQLGGVGVLILMSSGEAQVVE